MEYYLVDTETTGLKNGFHELTEISIIRCKDRAQRVWMIKIKHPERASKEALHITGKTTEELLSRGRYVDEILDEVDDFLNEDKEEPDGRVMIAHNAAFDRRFLEGEWEKHQRIWKANYWLDTKEMGRKFVKTISNPTNAKISLSLENLLKVASIKGVEVGAHSAEVDARNTYRLWDKLTKTNGLSNVEFTKLSPTIMNGLGIVKTADKKPKLKKDFDLNDIGDGAHSFSSNYSADIEQTDDLDNSNELPEAIDDTDNDII